MENRKPIIGVTPGLVPEAETYHLRWGYMAALTAAGALPVMLPLINDPANVAVYAEQCDGFLFSGGSDIDPAWYGEAKLNYCGEVVPERDAMEWMLMELALRQDKPLLGICRGSQVLNVFLGGTLYQDLPTQCPGSLAHYQDPPYMQQMHGFHPSHWVTVEPGSPLYSLTGRDRIQVNSYHHQAVKDLAPGLAVMARAEDGVIEAVCMPEREFVWAVQWHPELFYNVAPSSQGLFDRLVTAAQKRKNQET